jgi:large subunit ribosomal protein L24
MKMSIKKDDLVIVLSGKDAGKTGKVLVAMPKSGKVVVEGVNVVTRATRATQNQATGQMNEGGLVKKEAPIYACKVQRVCPKCGKPTRAASKIENGTKVRVCKKCGAEI